MNHEELTPGQGNRYYGTMPDTPEARPNQDLEQQGPGPVREGELEEPQGILDVSQEVAERAKKQEKLTSNALKDTAARVGDTQNAVDVLQQAEFVAAAARSLHYNIEQDKENPEAQAIGKQMNEEGGLLGQIEEIEAAIKRARPKDAQDMQTILAQRGKVAQLAKELSKYYEEAKISNEYDDPFKQIVSFEELMTKFNITNTDPEFKPDGQFPLLKISKYFDAFGREMITEEAHPENFLRWIQKKIQFYHDFDPMASIDLFQGMYIVAGSRKISMYEILVDFDAYFAHRERKSGDLKVQEPDLERAGVNKTYRDVRDASDPSLNLSQAEKDELEELAKQGILGYYTNFKVADPDNPGQEKRVKAYVSAVSEIDQQSRREGLHRVFYRQKGLDREGKSTVIEMPVQAWLSNRDQWEPQKNTAYDAIKEDILYEVWLMMKNHNMDVTYRQEAMPSEAPLKEKMAQLYSDNIWTRTRDRILRLWKSASTTKYEDEDGNLVSEAELMMRGELKGDGSLGRARRRATAFLYHISEANAPYAGYNLGGDKPGEGFNPAKEMLKGRDGMDYSETFYKSLLRQTLVKNLKYGEYSEKAEEEKKPQECHVAVELVRLLNETQVRTKKKDTNGNWDGTFRNRFDWEKVDLMDLVLMKHEDFLATISRLRVTEGDYEKAVDGLKEKYAGDATKLDQLKHLREDSVGDRKKALATLVEGELGKGDEKEDKDEKGNIIKRVPGKDGRAKDKFLFKDPKHPEEGLSDDPLAGLDAFAISAFVRSFASEYTPGINPYEHIHYSLEARDRMRQALRDTLVRTERLDAFEATYAEEWAYTFTYHTGISARNDMMGIGHDAWSKILNTEYYRLRQSGGGNYPGNLENLYGIHRLGTDFWQGLKVKVDSSPKYDKTLYEMLTGLEAVGRFDINKDLESFEFSGNAMRQFIGDHLGHAIDLFIDITSKHEFNLDKLITQDNWGRLIVNHEEMQKMIDSTWKHMRYGFDNNGFLYDNLQYGWLYDETINADGAVSRTPHFGFAKLEELMFSKELREMDMYDRKDVSSWRKSSEKKMGRNVFAYLIAKQIAEHVNRKEHKRVYSADEVVMIMTAFMEYSARVMQGPNGEVLRMSGFFSPEEAVRILGLARALIWQLYFKEYGVSMGGGMFFGILEALALAVGQIGEGIRL